MTVTLESVLSREDLLKERTPQELTLWVQQKCLELSSHEDLKEYILLRKGLCGEFYTEVYPLSLLANQLYPGRPDIGCRPNLTNENFDAQIIDYSASPPKVHKIEFTQAIEEYKEHLRMVYFLREGHVPVLGKVVHRGTKRTGLKIAVDDGAVDRNVTVDKGLRLIAEAARRKSESHYGKETSLVIVFDDYVAFRNAGEKSKLEHFSSREVLSLELDFYKLYLLGWSGETLLEFSC